MDTKNDGAVAMIQTTADGDVALAEASMDVDVVSVSVNVNVNVNTVNAGYSSADSDAKPSSGCRDKHRFLWVAISAAFMVAVMYGVAVAVDIGASGDGGDSGKSLQASCSSLRNIRVAIAYDSSFCATFGGADGARREVERIVAMASTSWYSRPGLCVQLQLVHLEGNCESETDPYNRGDIESGCNGEGMLDYFGNYWNTNRRNVSRDAAHLFRTRPFTDWPDGCAYDRSLCENFGYSVNAFSSTMSAVRRAVLFAHELGHNAGADHIDPAQGDYIMEPIISRGTGGFSEASKDDILNYINSVNCIGTTVVAPAPPDDSDNGEIVVEIKLTIDDYAAETSLVLIRSDGSAVKTSSSGLKNNRAHITKNCVPANDSNDCYAFAISRSECDGIARGYGQGSFEVNVEGQRVGGGGKFSSRNSISFGWCSVEVGMSLHTDDYPEDTRVTMKGQRASASLWAYSFPKPRQTTV